MATLQQALQAVATDLARFAAKDNFGSLFAGVFGGNPGRAAVHGIQNQLLRGDLSRLARIEVIGGAQLGAANAAYASASNTIYVSDRFLAQATLGELRAVLLEEFGHAIDARVNVSDQPGDEGELFSLLVRGLTPTASERQRILADDDRRTLTINGAQVAVELAAPVVYETTNIFPTSSTNTNPSSGSIDYYISGLNAIWSSRKGANEKLYFFNGSSTSVIATSIYNGFEYRGADIDSTSVAYIKRNDTGSDVYHFSGGITKRLTTNSAIASVLIEGNTTAWQTEDATGGEIYRHNGTSTSRVTNNTVEEEDIQLSGNSLLWAAFDGNDYEIYLNDGIKTRALTNNSVDDYSPVFSANRAAWLQWNNNQENLLFYDGSSSRQLTTNLEITNPLLAGNNLVYQQHEPSGDVSLKFYNSTSQATSTLTSNLKENSDVRVSGNLVAWLEANDKDENSSSLKLFNGSSTSVVTRNITRYSQFIFRGSKLLYVGIPVGSKDDEGELFLYDVNSAAASSTQLTEGEKISYLEDIDIIGDKVLWAIDFPNKLKLTQPTTKPSLSFNTTTNSVVEGFTSPQTANLTVNLSKASTTPVSVRWETFTDWNDDNEAFEGSDYTKSSGVLTFGAGVTSQTISVPILNNKWEDWSEAEEEVFHVRLLDPSNAVLVPGQSKASITISDTWQVNGTNGATFTLPADVDKLTLLGSSNTNGVGNSNSNAIVGNSGNNRLDGGGGFNDSLIGGPGDDTYIVRNSLRTQITEKANEGIDTVEFSPQPLFFSDSYSLENNLENLILTGTQDLSGSGNTLNNIITGNSGNNSLEGDGGIDTVNYAGAPAAVVVNLGSLSASGWGDDTLRGFENVTGSSFNDTITGDSGNNVLTGGAGADRITGGGGADKFDYRVLTDSLLSSGLDVIPDFNANAGADKLLVGTARAGFLNGGAVSALTNSAIGAKLTTTAFLPHYAASFQVGSGAAMRTYIAINNGSAGFSFLTDTLINVTGLSGTIDASHFVTS